MMKQQDYLDLLIQSTYDYGVILTYAGELEAAEHNLLLSNRLSTSIGENRKMFLNSLYLGNLFLRKREFTKAEKYFDLSERLILPTYNVAIPMFQKYLGCDSPISVESF